MELVATMLSLTSYFWAILASGEVKLSCGSQLLTQLSVTTATFDGSLTSPETVQVAVILVSSLGVMTIEVPVWPFDHETTPEQRNAVSVALWPKLKKEDAGLTIGGKGGAKPRAVLSAKLNVMIVNKFFIAFIFFITF